MMFRPVIYRTEHTEHWQFWPERWGYELHLSPSGRPEHIDFDIRYGPQPQSVIFGRASEDSTDYWSWGRSTGFMEPFTFDQWDLPPDLRRALSPIATQSPRIQLAPTAAPIAYTRFDGGVWFSWPDGSYATTIVENGAAHSRGALLLSRQMRCMRGGPRDCNAFQIVFEDAGLFYRWDWLLGVTLVTDQPSQLGELHLGEPAIVRGADVTGHDPAPGLREKCQCANCGYQHDPGTLCFPDGIPHELRYNPTVANPVFKLFRRTVDLIAYTDTDGGPWILWAQTPTRAPAQVAAEELHRILGNRYDGGHLDLTHLGGPAKVYALALSEKRGWVGSGTALELAHRFWRWDTMNGFTCVSDDRKNISSDFAPRPTIGESILETIDDQLSLASEAIFDAYRRAVARVGAHEQATAQMADSQDAVAQQRRTAEQMVQSAVAWPEEWAALTIYLWAKRGLPFLGDSNIAKVEAYLRKIKWIA